MILYKLLLIAPLTACAATDPQSINGMAENHGWTKAGKANKTVVFNVGDPSVPCQQQADGCEQHLSTFSIITTRKNWCEEPADLIAHELAHACGWRHPQ